MTRPQKESKHPLPGSGSPEQRSERANNRAVQSPRPDSIDIGKAPHSNKFRITVAATVILIIIVIVMVITDTQSTGEFPLRVPTGPRPAGGF